MILNILIAQCTCRIFALEPFCSTVFLLFQASGVVAGCQRTTEDVVKAALEFLREFIKSITVFSVFSALGALKIEK